MSRGDRYEVHFANGDVRTCTSVEAAELTILQETDHDQAPAGLLPAEIWRTGPEPIGAGQHVRTVREPRELH